MSRTNELKLFLLSLTSITLFILSWEYDYFYFLLFFSIVPLLLILQNQNSFKSRFITIYVTLFFWNLYALYGFFYTGYYLKIILLIFLNSLICSIPFLFSKVTKFHFLFFTSLWLTIEYFHLHSSIGFPFLLLGNLLAKKPMYIQWYEYTGVLGGSLWVISINYFSYVLIKNISFLNTVRLGLIVLIPIYISTLVLEEAINAEKNGASATLNTLLVHTKLDCKNQKYKLKDLDLVNYHAKLINSAYTDSIDLILLPENAVILGNNTNYDIYQNHYIDTLTQKINFKHTTVISGAITLKLLDRGIYIPEANFDKSLGRYFSVTNNAFCVNKNVLLFQGKNKLVPFDEYLPFPSVTNILRYNFKVVGLFKFTPSTTCNVFPVGDNLKIGIPICYESLFGAYVSNFTCKGANILGVILNEGWYSNKVIANRFLHYASLRAIENRRDVIRSSNMGYSSLTDRYGTILISNELETAINVKAKTNNDFTFYVLYGDFVGIIAIIVLCITLFFNYKISKL